LIRKFGSFRKSVVDDRVEGWSGYGSFPKIAIFWCQKSLKGGKVEALTEKQILETLRKGFTFPPLEIREIESEPELQSIFDLTGQRRRPDLILRFAWQNKERRFLAEVKQRSSPRSVEDAVRQIQLFIKTLQDLNAQIDFLPLVVIPYLSPENLERLAANNVSGVDLCGNGVVIVPGEWFVYRTGAKNKFPSSMPIKNIYRGASSLVPRAFLMRPEFDSVGDVYDEIRKREGQITLPTVSKALKALQDDLLVVREQGIRLVDAGRLLDRLEREYRKPICRRRLPGRAPNRETSLAKMIFNAKENNIPVVAEDPSAYAVMPSSEQTINIFTPSIDSLLRGVEFTEDKRFPDVIVCETDDPTVYFDRQWKRDFYWMSPIELYLELRAGGKREQETADQMRDDIKEFRYYSK
jgi:hypothetical protein